MGRSRNGNKDIIFAGSRKAKVFENAKLRGKTVEDVGGINGVLGRRLRKAGHRTATSLSCQLSGMTKRNYLRYIMKVFVFMTFTCGHYRDVGISEPAKTLVIPGYVCLIALGNPVTTMT